MSSKKIKRRAKQNKVFKTIAFLIIIVCLIIAGIYIFINNKDKLLEPKNTNKTMFLASETSEVSLFTLEKEQSDNEEEPKEILIENKKVPRGREVVATDRTKIFENKTYYLIKIDNKEYYIEDINLASKNNEVVLEKNIYVRTATSILKTDGSKKIIGLANKKDRLEVTGYNKIKDDGTVDIYTVKVGEEEGLVYGKYISYTEEEAKQNYMADVYDNIHGKVKNSYGGGDAIGLDFYPNEKIEFEDNIMPDSVYSLYLNCGSNVINNIDSYIEFAKDTKINAFVVDIKDNESPAWPAKIFETLSPTSYNKAINTYESYKNAITKLKEAGFYVIGRITVFKDKYYIQDNPSAAISSKTTNEPYLHNKSYWPSAYNRDVWYFNVKLAEEAVKEFGFNEINFDYVRFPDKMNSVANKVDLKNIYEESKAQAIQRFIQYAKDVLHELEVYISIDVFGETTNATYTTAYGQYWPAISNEADVICAMPYPDHFGAGSYGLPKPWNEPYKLMNYWARYAYDRQKQTTSPAKVRTWIQAYDVMKYVDANGITYGAKEVEDEIRGLYDAGIKDGYITWLSNSSLSKYKTQKQAFNIDYGKEYSDTNG